VDARFDRPDLYRGDDGDLLVRKPFDVPKQERGPLLGGQRPERCIHGRERLAITGELRQVGPRRGRLGPCDVVIFRRIQRKLGSALPRPEVVEGAVRRDAEQPGPEREALERSDGSPRGEEGVLHDIFGVGRSADDAERVPIKRSLLSPREVFEGSGIAAACTLDEELNFAVWRGAQRAPGLSNPLKSLPVRVEERKKKVVVIGEDDEPIAVLLRDAISDEPGYQAVVVADGALVLETVRQVHADLLILDIMMPGLNGLEVYDRVREDAGVSDMPVLFVSANLPQFDGEFKRRKITSVLTKPFDLNELLGRVRSLCPA
jgi:CheY-like chemotaxis protein